MWVGCPEDSLLWKLLKETTVSLLPTRITGKTDRKSIKQIAEFVRKHNVDIINAQSSRDRYITIFARWFYKLPCRLIHTRRQLTRSMGILGQSTFYERGTDRIVAVSEGVKQSLVDIGIKASHINVIYNGTPPEKYQAIDTQAVDKLRMRYQITENDIVIGSVSRLKEQVQLLRALHYLNHPVKVILVGIERQSAYESIIDSYTVPHKIYFTGSVSNSEVLNYYLLFRINVLASTIEGLSQALLEAMAMGVPVVATRMGGNVELIQHGENGLLFENNDTETLAQHLNTLIDDHELHQRLAQRGKVTALQDFSIERTLDCYEAFFHELIS